LTLTISAPGAIPLRLHDEIVGKLRGMILRCELVPGARVAERELCEQFGISRTPLREALKVLAANGLVELWPNRGARIARLQPMEIADVFDVLALLERRAGELAAARLDARGLAEMQRLHKRLMAQAALQRREATLQVDLQIHRALVKAAGSATLLSVHDALAIKVERARYFVIGISQERFHEALQEHERILEAVLALDAQRMADELYSHCVKTRDAVVAAVRARFADDRDAEEASAHDASE
jgi:DNA-binding GntR family transcriptional regulator